jgi:hypothetical protein
MHRLQNHSSIWLSQSAAGNWPAGRCTVFKWLIKGGRVPVGAHGQLATGHWNGRAEAEEEGAFKVFSAVTGSGGPGLLSMSPQDSNVDPLPDRG